MKRALGLMLVVTSVVAIASTVGTATCNGYPLFLATTKRHASLSHHCLKFFIKTLNFIVNTGLLCCLFYFGKRSIIITKFYIIFYAVAE